jgi:hypothetical protein
VQPAGGLGAERQRWHHPQAPARPAAPGAQQIPVVPHRAAGHHRWRPGWRINHSAKVAIVERLGLVSAYHRLRNEPHGQETEPTLYWRDRRKDGPTYHIDYIFLPIPWIAKVRDLRLGTFEDWCGSGLSDHVPIVAEIDL